MGKCYVLYNPLSNNKKGEELAKAVKDYITCDELKFVEITKIKDINEYIASVSSDDKIVIAGGDGTLNHFLNSYSELKRNIYFYPCGNGNDFARDINCLNKLILLNEHINKIPSCIINGEKRKYINGVGMGLDGYVCAKVNELRDDKKDVNYIGVALKGVIGGYKRTNLRVKVDGKAYTFNDVWLCSAMKGRFCGGGFMFTPHQDRMLSNNRISLMVVHNASMLKILYAFTLVFKGKHTRLKKNVTILTGNNIEILSDTPSYFQLDGETYENITSFSIDTSDEKILV